MRPFIVTGIIIFTNKTTKQKMLLAISKTYFGDKQKMNSYNFLTNNCLKTSRLKYISLMLSLSSSVMFPADNYTEWIQFGIIKTGSRLRFLNSLWLQLLQEKGTLYTDKNKKNTDIFFPMTVLYITWKNKSNNLWFINYKLFIQKTVLILLLYGWNGLGGH